MKTRRVLTARPAPLRSALVDAKILVSTMTAALEKFRQSGPNVQVLHLPSDFSTAEAGQAGVDLVNRVQSLLKT